jgi:hypothetical protein
MDKRAEENISSWTQNEWQIETTNDLNTTPVVDAAESCHQIRRRELQELQENHRRRSEKISTLKEKFKSTVLECMSTDTEDGMHKPLPKKIIGRAQSMNNLHTSDLFDAAESGRIRTAGIEQLREHHRMRSQKLRFLRERYQFHAAQRRRHSVQDF